MRGVVEPLPVDLEVLEQETAEVRLHRYQLDHITPYYSGIFEGEPLPKDGALELDENKPGFGLTLIRDGLHRPYERDIEWSQLNAAANLYFKEDEPRMKL